MSTTTKTTTPWTLITLLALTLAPAASAQEPARPLDAAAARARAGEFLTVGALAPRPDLRRADLEDLDAVEVVDTIHGPAFDLLLRRGDGRLRLVVRVERAQGRVLYFSQPERDSVVPCLNEDRTPRTPAEIDEEADARTLLDGRALRARAEAWVAHLVPEVATGARRFEVVSQRTHRDGLLIEAFVLLEVPADGVLACFRNMVQLDLSPETGEVVSARRTDLRGEVRDAPAIDAAAALRVARARVQDAAPLGPPRLEVIPVERRTSQPGARKVAAAWLVAFPPLEPGAPLPRVVAVAADDGRVLDDE